MLRMIARVLRVLSSEAEPSKISIAVCLGMVAGLTPFLSPHNLLVLFLVLVIRVNLSAFILGIIFFSGTAYALDPFFDSFGRGVLTTTALEGIWTSMYNTTLFRMLNFNNTILMGSLLFSLILFVPLVFVFNVLISKYREHVLSWVERTYIMKAFKASRLYGLYRAYGEIGGRP